VLPLPTPRVLAQIKDFWHADRKPANVQLVVDTSTSMQEGDKITHAIKGLQTFLRQLSPREGGASLFQRRAPRGREDRALRDQRPRCAERSRT
jgi:hypothetical protein